MLQRSGACVQRDLPVAGQAVSRLCPRVSPNPFPGLHQTMVRIGPEDLGGAQSRLSALLVGPSMCDSKGCSLQESFLLIQSLADITNFCSGSRSWAGLSQAPLKTSVLYPCRTQAFYYPEEAGVAFGGPNSSSYLRLEVHYHNPRHIHGKSVERTSSHPTSSSQRRLGAACPDREDTGRVCMPETTQAFCSLSTLLQPAT